MAHPELTRGNSFLAFSSTVPIRIISFLVGLDGPCLLCAFVDTCCVCFYNVDTLTVCACVHACMCVCALHVCA